MIAEIFAFYLFSLITVIAAVMVVSARNPVHSVLFLILAFFNSAGLFVLLGAEFLAMILVVVYVGAVAVLFMFVVMMLDISVAEMKQGFLQYLPLGGVVALILMLELAIIVGGYVVSPRSLSQVVVPVPKLTDMPNTEAISLFFVLTTATSLLFAETQAIQENTDKD